MKKVITILSAIVFVTIILYLVVVGNENELITFNGYRFTIDQKIWDFDTFRGPSQGLSGEEYVGVFYNKEFGYEVNLLLGDSEPEISNAYQPLLYSANDISNRELYIDTILIPETFILCNEELGYSYSCSLIRNFNDDEYTTEWYGSLMGYAGAHVSISKSISEDSGFPVDKLGDAIKLINDIYLAESE